MSASGVSWLGYRARVGAATAFVVLTAVFTLARNVQYALKYGGVGVTDANRLVERFHVLRAELPHVDSVGYVTDAGPLRKADLRMDDLDAKTALREYFLTRYILAPTIVTYGASHDYVVGNLSTPSAVTTIAQTLNLDIVRDFGDGVVLFRRHTP